MYKLYGIPNCDTVKKARNYLDKNEITYEFVNFKKDSVDLEMIKRWKNFVGDWPVNKRGRTYRELKDDFEDSSDSQKMAMIQENTSLIKRPVLEKGKKVMCLGFELDIFNNL